AYGSQELSSVPVEAGQSKDGKLTARPPQRVPAGNYPVSVTLSAEDAKASSEVSLEIVGQPDLRISGRDGIVSARAEAGNQTSVPIVVTNEGTAAAEAIDLSATGPSGWTLEFEPKQIERVEPGQRAEAQLRLTPSAKSLAGDY